MAECKGKYTFCVVSGRYVMEVNINLRARQNNLIKRALIYQKNTR